MSTLASHHVMVLNKHYRAVNVVSVIEALGLLFRGVAEIVDVEEDKKFYPYDFESWAAVSEYKLEFESERYDWIQCVSSKLAMPRIVRLLTFSKYKPTTVRFSRRNIYDRDGLQCQYCGKRYRKQDLNLDHVIPVSKGGRSRWENVVCSCIACNTRKRNRTPQEAGMHLLRTPRQPTKVRGVTNVRYDCWKTFVDEAYWNVELKD